MATFIQLTNRIGEPILVNLDRVETVGRNGSGSAIYTNGNDPDGIIDIQESFAKVRSIINKALAGSST